MRKPLLLLVIISMLWSCKNPNNVLPSPSNNFKEGKLQSFAAADGTWDLLGYGLDVTGDLLNSSSVSDVAIFDMTKFANDFRNRIDVNATTEGTEQYYSGATALDYFKDVSTKKSFDANANATIEGSDANKKILNFTGSFSKNSSDQNTTTYSSRFSYATYEVTQRVKRIRFTGDVNNDLLIQYLTPEFKSNIANMNADALVARYGTHIMLDISIGGRLKFNYSGSVVNNASYEKKTSYVKAGLGFSILKVMGININADKTTEEITKITNETRDKQYTGKYYGGTNSGRSISIDKDGNSSETINIASWQSSVTPSNAALLDVGKAVFLDNFITDPVKKAQVKAAIEKHILDSQAKMSDPIYRYYSTKYIDHFYSVSDVVPTDYISETIGFEAYKTQAPNTIPIYRYVQPGAKQDHYYTTVQKNYPGYNYEGIEFYAYSTQVPGTLPVYSYYQPNTIDHFYTIDTRAENLNGYLYEKIVFYAFPGLGH